MEVTGGPASQFFDSYRAGFETMDPDVICDYFAYPCHLTSDAGEVMLSVGASRDEWREQIAGLVGLYRAAGVASATALSTSETELSAGVVQTGVHWSILDAAGDQLYDFHALYTLVRRDDSFKIAAIAFDELPRLLSVLPAPGGPSA